MNEYEFELSPEAQEQLREIAEKAVKAFQIFYDALVEIATDFLEQIRQIGIYFGRLFFKMQLLEWRISPRWAELISQRIYWYWACKIGFAWFQRKFLSA